ncbi:pseudouridine synthase [Porphyromonas circumdentaria]|uniref:Pseudouridine synthase n=1 Tax=Porphyromonas circumdentaria TaxID=29524 RepID=A0A1T4NJL7_9PORP|nr:pseudouridine synthase [Porphyromonas circumdentaria]MBB6276102.1 23S rRNA pseudouridine2605 synthase [Porphyromonas circumdentaria]MDO4722768.1 pseudouridine synthase [Porphyromonas circumdentaria]SJZ79227.1 23S rRNA pseudouridine2605 synthase [Porphyromonas circumdentaria]
MNEKNPLPLHEMEQDSTPKESTETSKKRVRTRITKKENSKESCILVGTQQKGEKEASIIRRNLKEQYKSNPLHSETNETEKDWDASFERILKDYEALEENHNLEERAPLQQTKKPFFSSSPRKERTFNSNYPFAKSASNNAEKRAPFGNKKLTSERKEGYNANKKGKKKRKIQPAPKEVISYPEANEGSTDFIRLNKFLANSGICSRRKADELIAAGKVSVNGAIVTTLGAHVTRQDEITCEGKVVSIERKIYVLLNKPKNCVTTSDDPEKRLTVMDIVRNACPERIYPVGRLDRNTSGVLLLTNDGDLASKLMHPSYSKKKIYQVTLDKPVSVEHMQQIAEGIELEDGEIHADAISYINDQDLSQVGIEIHSGRNRIVRRIFEHLGYKVNKLDRVYFAGLTKKDLPRGRWRYLTEVEVRNLRMDSYE